VNEPRDLDIQASSILRDIRQSNSRIIINQGGTGSSKTWSTLLYLIALCALAAKQNKRILISVFSTSLPHLKKGAYRDFKEILRLYDLYRDDNHNKTDHIYTLWGSEIEFIGLDDPDKARGPRRDYAYLNEANLLTKEHYRQIAQRTREQIFLDLNPSDNHSWVYDLADGGDDDVDVIISNYKDNPFISDGEKKEIERLVPVWKRPDGSIFRDWQAEYDPKGDSEPPKGWIRLSGDYNLWKVYGLGLRGSPQEIIYGNWEKIAWGRVPDPEDCTHLFGIDYGFNSPSSIVECRIRDMNLYVKVLLHQSGLLNSQLIEKMDQIGIPKEKEIYADAAEPDRIEEMFQAGYNIKPADKSVKDGIDYVKRHNIFVAKDSVSMHKELNAYKWKTNKQGSVLDEPVKLMDHDCDAMRYPVYTNSKQADSFMSMA
jgi:phage terminase large subunit